MKKTEKSVIVAIIVALAIVSTLVIAVAQGSGENPLGAHIAVWALEFAAGTLIALISGDARQKPYLAAIVSIGFGGIFLVTRLMDSGPKTLWEMLVLEAAVAACLGNAARILWAARRGRALTASAR